MANSSIESFAEKRGVLVSRVDHPVVIQYGEEHLRLSPRGQTKALIRRLLPAELPPGVTYVER